MPDAVEGTSLRVMRQIRAILLLYDGMCGGCRGLRCYSKKSMGPIICKVYRKAAFVVDAGTAERDTVAPHPKELESFGGVEMRECRTRVVPQECRNGGPAVVTRPPASRGPR